MEKLNPELIRKYNDLCNQLTLAFRPVQQEAMQSYAEWEKQFKKTTNQE